MLSTEDSKGSRGIISGMDRVASYLAWQILEVSREVGESPVLYDISFCFLERGEYMR